MHLYYYYPSFSLTLHFDGGRAKICIKEKVAFQARSGILRRVSTSGKWVEGFGA